MATSHEGRLSPSAIVLRDGGEGRSEGQVSAETARRCSPRLSRTPALTLALSPRREERRGERGRAHPHLSEVDPTDGRSATMKLRGRIAAFDYSSDPGQYRLAACWRKNNANRAATCGASYTCEEDGGRNMDIRKITDELSVAPQFRPRTWRRSRCGFSRRDLQPSRRRIERPAMLRGYRGGRRRAGACLADAAGAVGQHYSRLTSKPSARYWRSCPSRCLPIAIRGPW